MKVDADGWIDEARRVPSPNCDQRPEQGGIDLVVIHGISLPPGEYGGPWIDDLFLNRLEPTAHPYFAEVHTLRVSSHLLIRRDGELVQYVSLHHRAWHAGASCYEGRERCNDFSIGIELEGSDDEPYSDAQYHCLARLLSVLQATFPTLSPERVAGHSEIAPGRKTDPGPHFEWDRLYRLLGYSGRPRLQAKA